MNPLGIIFCRFTVRGSERALARKYSQHHCLYTKEKCVPERGLSGVPDRYERSIDMMMVKEFESRLSFLASSVYVRMSTELSSRDVTKFFLLPILDVELLVINLLVLNKYVILLRCTSNGYPCNRGLRPRQGRREIVGCQGE